MLTRLSRGKPIVGALAGAVVALMLYEAYSFAAPRLQAVLIDSSVREEPAMQAPPQAAPVEDPIIPVPGGDAADASIESDAIAVSVIPEATQEVALRAEDFQARLQEAASSAVHQPAVQDAPTATDLRTAAPVLARSGSTERIIIPLTMFAALLAYLRKRSLRA